MIKCYARIFSITGVLFFLGMLFSNLLVMAPRQALFTAMADGILFGIVMSLIIGTMHVSKARKAAGTETSGDIYAIRQYRELESALDPDRLFTALTQYLSKSRGFTLTQTDQGAGKLSARTPFSFMSLGNTVSVSLEKSPGGTLVKILARPSYPTVLADYGGNLRIANELRDHLRAL
jgi:hypothetical protein